MFSGSCVKRVLIARARGERLATGWTHAFLHLLLSWATTKRAHVLVSSLTSISITLRFFKSGFKNLLHISPRNNISSSQPLISLQKNIQIFLWNLTTSHILHKKLLNHLPCNFTLLSLIFKKKHVQDQSKITNVRLN